MSTCVFHLFSPLKLTRLLKNLLRNRLNVVTVVVNIIVSLIQQSSEVHKTFSNKQVVTNILYRGSRQMGKWGFRSRRQGKLFHGSIASQSIN